MGLFEGVFEKASASILNGVEKTLGAYLRGSKEQS